MQKIYLSRPLRQERTWEENIKLQLRRKVSGDMYWIEVTQELV